MFLFVGIQKKKKNNKPMGAVKILGQEVLEERNRSTKSYKPQSGGKKEGDGKER